MELYLNHVPLLEEDSILHPLEIHEEYLYNFHLLVEYLFESSLDENVSPSPIYLKPQHRIFFKNSNLFYLHEAFIN